MKQPRQIKTGDRVSSPSTGTMLGTVLSTDTIWVRGAWVVDNVDIEWDNGVVSHGEAVECLTVYGNTKDDDHRLSTNNEEPVY